MNILYLCQHFHTPKDAGGSRPYEFSKYLVKNGHNVTLISGKTDRNLSVANNAKSKIETTDLDGVKLIRVNNPYSNKMGFVTRIRSFLNFVYWASKIAKKQKNVDIVFATSTPLTTAIPGVIAKRKHKTPFVFEVRDLWPELPKAMGVIKNPVILWLIRKLELWAYKNADFMIALAPGIKKGMVKTGFPKDKIEVIPNGADVSLFSLAELKNRTKEITLIFTGAHGLANGLDAVLDAAEVLQNKNEKGIKFLFVGDGSQKRRLMEKSRKLNLSNVEFRDPIPKADLAKLMQEVDVGMMILDNIPAFYEGTSPNKFFDYLAAGLPVINNYPGWLKSIIDKDKCGIAVPPNDPGVFADAVLYFRDNPDKRIEMGKNSRKIAEETFARNLLAEKFKSSLENVNKQK